MSIDTTLGNLLVNQALPEELRDYARVFDKKGLASVMRKIADEHPDKYVEVSKRLADLGREASTRTGGNSFGLQYMLKSKLRKAASGVLQNKIDRILDDDNLTDKQREELVVRQVGTFMDRQMADVFDEAVKNKNPLADQVISGSRGNKMNLSSLLGSDGLYSDQNDNVMAVPVLRSYSEGLTPAQYWTGTYGARRGVLAAKFAVRDAGYLSKQMNQLAHRLVVVGDDAEDDDDDPEDEEVIERRKLLRGVPVDSDDEDSVGSLLAQDIGPYKRNTVLSPKILHHLQRLNHKRILIRSPIVGGSADGGVYARDVGVREFGRLPGRGEQVGLTAAQALSEPLSQGSLSAKHSGGVAGQEKSVSGFKSIDQQIQIPKGMRGGAAHADVDGRVEKISPAPAGGSFVTINGKEHYVGQGFELKVKPGDDVEAGDILSEGIPDHSKIVEHKGVGEGRRYFANALRKSMLASNMGANRRNAELVARGLINHVELTDEYGDYVEGDTLPYVSVERNWRPREGHENLELRRAQGMYLERPVLHYTIGTKIRPSVVRDLEEFGVKQISVHKDPPPFRAKMVRGMSNLQHDPDWMTRMYGSGLKKSLLDATHHGAISDEQGTSFVPSLARAVNFGRSGGAVRQPEMGKKPVEGQPIDKVHQTIKPSPPRLPPAPQQPQRPVPSTTPQDTSRGVAYKIARLLKRGDDIAKPATPAKPPSVSSSGGIKPVQPAQPASGGLASPMPKPNWATPITPSIATGGGNQFAFHGGYRGANNTGQGQNFGGIVTSRNLAQFGQALDADGMATLTGANMRNGVYQQQGRYQQGVDPNQPSAAFGDQSLPQGNYGYPGGGWSSGSRFQMPTAQPQTPQLAATTPQTPQNFANNAVKGYGSWQPGSKEYNSVAETLAKRRGVATNAVSPAEVRNHMFDQQRLQVAADQAGYMPGGAKFESVRPAVTQAVLAQMGINEDLPSFIQQLQGAINDKQVSPEQAQEASALLKRLTSLQENGPSRDDVLNYVQQNKLVDAKNVHDFEVTDSVRQQEFAKQNPLLSQAGEIGKSLVSLEGNLGYAPLAAGWAAGWHGGGYKLYNAARGMMPYADAAGAMAKSPGFLKGVARTAMPGLRAFGPAYHAYDFGQAYLKPHEEQLDRFNKKTQGSKNVGLLPYYLENVSNIGDNTVAAMSGLRDANEIAQEGGRAALSGKKMEAGLSDHRLNTLTGKTDANSIQAREQARQRLAELRAEEAASGSTGFSGIATGIGRMFSTTPMNSYMRPGQVDKSIETFKSQMQDAKNLDAVNARNNSILQHAQALGKGEDVQKQVPGFSDLWSHDRSRTYTPNAGDDDTSRYRNQVGDLLSQAEKAVGLKKDLTPQQRAALSLHVASLADKQKTWSAFGQEHDESLNALSRFGPHASKAVEALRNQVNTSRQEAWQKKFPGVAMPADTSAAGRMFLGQQALPGTDKAYQDETSRLLKRIGLSTKSYAPTNTEREAVKHYSSRLSQELRNKLEAYSDQASAAKAYREALSKYNPSQLSFGSLSELSDRGFEGETADVTKLIQEYNKKFNQR